MTLPSSCAPLTGISRARLPAWRCPTAGRRRPTVNRCWRTGLSRQPDRRTDPNRPADSRPVGPGGALTLPGLVEPHAHLDKTFTIERCRPAQAGLLPAIHAMHEDRRHWSRWRIFNAERPPRWPGRQRMA